MTERQRSNALLIVLGLLLVFVIVVGFTGGIAVLGIPNLRHLFWGWDFPMRGHWVGFFPFFGLFSLSMVIQLALAIWVGLDASKRGMSGLLWGLLVFFTFVVGLIVYLIVVQATNSHLLPAEGAAARPPGSESPQQPIVASPPSQPAAGSTSPPAPMQPPAAPAPVTSCSQCGGEVQPAFKVCPYCGVDLGPRCPGCGRSAGGDWKICPYCSTSLPG